MTRIPSRTTTGALKTGKLTPEQEAEAAELRLAFVLEIGRCEVCGYDHDWQRLCVHEIIRSGGVRKWTKVNRSTTLVVCHDCHMVKIHKENMPVIVQLAYVHRSRPFDLKMDEINRYSIKRVRKSDVAALARRLDEPPAAGR